MASHTKNFHHKKHRLRYDRLALLLLPIVLLIGAGWFAVRWFNPLELKSEEYIVQPLEAFNPKGNIKSVFLASPDDVQYEGDNVNTEAPTTAQGAYVYKGRRYPFTIKVEDTLPPDMTLKDVSTDTTQTVVAEDFIDKIYDVSGFTLRMDSESDITKPGTYTVTITAQDPLNHQSSKKATLHRIEDKKAPVLENFEKTATVRQGGTYAQKQYTLKDDLDTSPVLHMDASQLDTTTPGKYPVTYTTRDRSGNEQVYTQEVEVVANPDYGKKICYLTFDDGPSANTLKILDVLRQYDVKATFFVTGAHPDKELAIMKDITNQGSAIGLHTFSHDYAKLYANDEAYFNDLQKISDLVEKETGVKSDIIRFPGGSSNQISAPINPGIMSRLVDAVQAKGYQYFDWNVDSTDASGNGVPVSTLVANATAGIGMDDVVILMHDTDAKSTTVEALPQIIQAYKDAGYIFRPLDTQSNPVHHGVQN